MIDVISLRQALAAVQTLPAPGSVAHFKHMVFKAECIRLLTDSYDHKRAVLLLTAMAGPYGRLAWRWVSSPDWQEGYPIGADPTRLLAGRNERLVLGLVPHPLGLPTLTDNVEFAPTVAGSL